MPPPIAAPVADDDDGLDVATKTKSPIVKVVAVEVAGRFVAADLSSCCGCWPAVGVDRICIDGSCVALLLRFRTGGVGGADDDEEDEDEDEVDDAADDTADETEDEVFEDDGDVNEAMPSSSAAASPAAIGASALADAGDVAR